MQPEMTAACGGWCGVSEILFSAASPGFEKILPSCTKKYYIQGKSVFEAHGKRYSTYLPEQKELGGSFRAGKLNMLIHHVIMEENP